MFLVLSVAVAGYLKEEGFAISLLLCLLVERTSTLVAGV
jgi:hypothetical protein